MQSTSIQDFPPNFKRRLELQNQHNLQYQQLQQQQEQEEDPNYIIQEPPFKKHRPGIGTNLLYKFVEFATYTTAFASDIKNTFHTITGSHPTKQDYDYNLKIDDDDYDHNKKDVSTWGEHVENEEEPPPPYDNSWSMPSSTVTFTSTTTNNDISPETKPSLTISTTPSLNTQQQNLTTTTQSPTQSPNSASRRRQIRVRRGRRFVRRKSSSVDMRDSFNYNNSSTSTHSENNVDEEEEDIFLKFNCKLADMIAEGTAALNSKVEVTEVEMILAEEKEREERIMKELGIQSPMNRRPRTNFNVQNYNFDYNNYNNNYNYLHY